MFHSESADILIVDDTPVNLDILNLVLTRAHYHVRMANNGMEALKEIAAQEPDLVLLDIMMPELDGLDTCRALKADPKTRHIPVIFITSLDNVTQKVKGFDAGAIDYIIKPFQKEEVLARIHTHLQLIYQKRELEQQNQLLSNFAHIAANDLKSPLIRMAGFTKILLKDWSSLSNSPETYVQEIEESRYHMLASIDNLLLLEDVRKPEISFDTLAMREIIQETRLQLSYLVEKYHAKISILPASFPTVIGHPTWVAKIWAVFLRHGFTHGGIPPQIEIGYTEIGQGIRFWLRDHGSPLSASFWQNLLNSNLMQQFNALEPKALEFAVIKELIQRMGGELGAGQPEKGQGNVLFFTLPLAKAR
jgi:CheY-like chemotaxis protein